LKLGYNPPCFFWIAEFKDGKATPQFDPDTGEESFLDYEKESDKLKSFGWYPISYALAEKMPIEARVKNLPRFVLHLEKGDKLIAKRRQSIHRSSYHFCMKCGEKWQFKKDSPKHEVTVIQNDKPETYTSAICPHCETYNKYVCDDCKDIVLSKNKQKEIFCTGCERKYPYHITILSEEWRETKYLLGVERDGYRKILFIDEDGNTVISNEEVTKQ